MALDPLDVRYFKLAVGDVRTETPQDISTKCPVCGDSQYSNKARLHLYQKKDVTLVNCFNGGCPCSNRTMYTFLRDFFPDLFNNYKKEKFHTAIRKPSGLESMTIDFGPVQEKPKLSLKPYLGPLTQECSEYISSRKVSHPLIFTAPTDANIDGKHFPIKGFIIIPLIKGNEIYGFYTRSPSTKRFYTFIKPEYVGYKAWNLFSVNLDEPVYIFEGIFDALSAQQAGLVNSIALLGAKPSTEMLNMIKHPVFCLDNDRTGIINSLEYCKRYDVVVWPFDDPKDANEMLQKNLDLYNIITDNIKTGIRATVALRAKL